MTFLTDISDRYEEESSDTSLQETIEIAYKGPHISNPITLADFHTLIDNFRKKRVSV